MAAAPPDSGGSSSVADPDEQPPRPRPRSAPSTHPAHRPPEDLGFDAKALERLAREAEAAGSTCLLVARDGVVAGEWYWNAGAPDRPQEVFSVTKSVTSTLVGLAQADGDLSLGDRAARTSRSGRAPPHGP